MASLPPSLSLLSAVRGQPNNIKPKKKNSLSNKKKLGAVGVAGVAGVLQGWGGGGHVSLMECLRPDVDSVAGNNKKNQTTIIIKK